MQIPVVVESLGLGQFRAQGLPPFTAVAEGATSEEALSKLREELNKEVESGKRVVMLDMGGANETPTEENPWLAMAGSLKGNPLFADWQAAIQEYRHQCDVEAGIERRVCP